jgi:hypothetical protein
MEILNFFIIIFYHAWLKLCAVNPWKRCVYYSPSTRWCSNGWIEMEFEISTQILLVLHVGKSIVKEGQCCTGWGDWLCLPREIIMALQDVIAIKHLKYRKSSNALLSNPMHSTLIEIYNNLDPHPSEMKFLVFWDWNYQQLSCLLRTKKCRMCSGRMYL